MGTLLLGKYRVEDLLGVGGMGSVVAARHEHLDERVALKLLHSVFASDPEVRQRFKREGPAAFKLRSEHVCRVFDAGELDDGTPFIAMELLEGETLARVLERRTRLPLAEAIDIALQVCEGLADAHANGVVHRDFKPSNLILTLRRDGSTCAKVIDFGISKTDLVGGDMTDTHAFVGSPSYAAPEQLASSKAATSKVDIWSVGVVLYYMLMGEHPFRVEGQSFPVIATMITRDEPRPMCARNPAVPREVEAAVLRCLAKDPVVRWNDLRELAAELDSFGSRPLSRWDSEEAHATTRRTAERPPPPRDETTATGIMPGGIRRSASAHVLDETTAATVITGPVALAVRDPAQLATGPQLPLPSRDSARVITGPQLRDAPRITDPPATSPPSDARCAPARAPSHVTVPAPSRWLAWAIAGLVVVLGTMLLLKLTFGQKPVSVATLASAPAPTPTTAPFTAAVAPGPASTGVAIEAGAPAASASAVPVLSTTAGRLPHPVHTPRRPAPSDTGPKIMKEWRAD